MTLFLRQTWTLTVKNLLVVLVRPLLSTVSYARNLFIEPATYGIGEPTRVRSFSDALNLVGAKRNRLIFIDNGFVGGPIEQVINEVAQPARTSQYEVHIFSNETQMRELCRTSLRGMSRCIAAAVFHSSPTEGPKQAWNYTIRTDAVLGESIDVNSSDNDQEIYLLPFQQSIDWAIARTNSSFDAETLPEATMEYPYTSLNEEERKDRIRTRYMKAIVDVVAVAIFIGIVGVTYQLTGLIAMEGELGMSQIIDCMMPNSSSWVSQAARFCAAHLALDIIYGPGWIIMGAILKAGVYNKTSAAITLAYHVLTGLALSTFSIFGPSFFKKAQLSGISVVLACLLLGVVAQMVPARSNGPVIILGLLFPSMNYVYFSIFVIAYPILAAVVERMLHDTASKNRQVSSSGTSAALSIRNLNKVYQPGWFYQTIGPWFGSNRQTVHAVNNLSLDVNKGQIMVLLGANGSGKSTTLDAIAGLTKLSSGDIRINYGEEGLKFGLCPQKTLKSTGKVDTNGQIMQLLKDCDLHKKAKAHSKTLSAGQNRKVQLAMMLIGGSTICCVDEVSSGLDTISRRKIWDILLAEKGSRTIILTTHFLDEADLLADHIAILSKGVLKADGSSVGLKNQLGSGYRIHVLNVPSGSEQAIRAPYNNIRKEVHFDETIYTVQDSAEAARFVSELEQEGVTEYRVSGPTIEDVFLRIASELDFESSREHGQEGEQTAEHTEPSSEGAEENVERRSLHLMTGRRIDITLQAWHLFRKRMTILRPNPLPYLAAFLIPVIAAGLVTLSSRDQWANLLLVIGPSSRVRPELLESFIVSMSDQSDAGQPSSNTSLFYIVGDFTEFNNYIAANYSNATPGGVYLGDSLQRQLPLAALTQKVLDRFVTGMSIKIGFQFFDIPSTPDLYDTLQLVVYFGLAMSVFPAFFALYPTVERVRNVRALNDSNGVRAISLWLAYISFDFCLVVASSVLAVIIFRAVTNIWYHIEYLFAVIFLYGLCGTLCAYLVSLFTKLQLAAFAFAAGFQCVMFLIYLIAYMCILTYAPTDKIDSYIEITHYTIALVSPSENLLRALFASLNVFSILCRGSNGREIASYPGEISLYGGPVLYLLLSRFFSVFSWLRPKSNQRDVEEKGPMDRDIAEEIARVSSSKDYLRLLHVSKTFKKFIAVEDVTFGVGPGEVFALLGPNGAGKTTTISLIRGDIQPTRDGGEIFFDAMDQMTVLEHLVFYARIRGVPDISYNVNEILKAVGLEPFRHRMAAKLSGGNKRKLSLGIALMGNPSVLLLDEPSSGMDAASKRVMWKTLAAVAPGRSILLTTHSMEEADALAHRAGIMARLMLALGTTDALRMKYGNMYHVHIVHTQAPHTSDEDMEKIREWVNNTFPGAVIEQKTYHGQLRFSVPANMAHEKERAAHSDDSKSSSLHEIRSADEVHLVSLHSDGSTPVRIGAGMKTGCENLNARNGVSKLFSRLEQIKAALGVEHYSVSQTTLDQVFLTIVGRHHIREEDSG
ncbi:hypothetical protein BDW66DRAFT_158588 [Aspergillus desertorum]